MRLLMMLLAILGSALLPAFAADDVHCPSVSHLALTKGEYSPRPGVSVTLDDFSAQMVPRGKRLPACMEKTTAIEHGHVFVEGASLSRLVGEKAQRSNASIRDLKIEVQGDHVVITGNMKKVISIPVRIEGPVDAVQDSLRLHATTIKAEHLPVKGVLSAFGMQLASLVHTQNMKGVKVTGDSIIFSPDAMLHVRGHIRSAKVENGGLAVDFGPAGSQTSQSRAKSKPGN